MQHSELLCQISAPSRRSSNSCHVASRSDKIPKALRRFIFDQLPTESIQQRFLGRVTLIAPTVAAVHTRKRMWFLNVDWPVHRRRLLQQVETMRPARGTSSMVVHTSPRCNMFSSAQGRNAAFGRYMEEHHRIAMSRLRFMRRLHAAWRRRRRRDGVRGMSLHEQPPGAKVDFHGDGRNGVLWPWAIGRRARRSSVNGCMLGIKNQNNVPIFKGWTFECDAPCFHCALRGFACSRDHLHACTPLSNGFRRDGTAGQVSRQSRIRYRVLECYPNSLGVLLTQACGLVR